jgi:hypothetical protein
MEDFLDSSFPRRAGKFERAVFSIECHRERSFSTLAVLHWPRCDVADESSSSTRAFFHPSYTDYARGVSHVFSFDLARPRQLRKKLVPESTSLIEGGVSSVWSI